MDVSEKNARELADYVYSDMSEEERVEFEVKLRNDSELTAELNRQKDILKGLRARLKYNIAMTDPNYDEVDKLAKNLIMKRDADLNKIQVEEPIKKKMSIRNYLLASAAIILILIISGTLFIHPTPDNLFHKYYAPFSSANFTIRSVEIAGTAQSNGILKYFYGDYDQSIDILSEQKEETGLTAEANFVFGLSYMATGDYFHAAGVFKDHLNQYSQLLYEVKWYLGLCYLQLNETDKAGEIFNELAMTSGKFGKNAKQLSRKLEKVKA